jgi:hypothetical protein
LAAPHLSTDLEPLARGLLFSLEHPALPPFRSEWPPAAAPTARPATGGAASLPVRASALPVLEWLAHIATRPHEFAATLVAALCHAAASLEWRQTYSLAEVGADFLRNYGYTEFIGASAERKSALLSSGFLLLGPHTLYPRHHHAAEEIYVSLSGTAGWLQGDAVWRQRAPGAVIHHAGGEPHAMRTADEPLLALYVWRGADLHQKARLGTA